MYRNNFTDLNRYKNVIRIAVGILILTDLLKIWRVWFCYR